MGWLPPSRLSKWWPLSVCSLYRQTTHTNRTSRKLERNWSGPEKKMGTQGKRRVRGRKIVPIYVLLAKHLILASLCLNITLQGERWHPHLQMRNQAWRAQHDTGTMGQCYHKAPGPSDCKPSDLSLTPHCLHGFKTNLRLISLPLLLAGWGSG